MVGTAGALGRLIDAKIRSRVGDGQLVAVWHVVIREVDNVNKVARGEDAAGFQHWLPYPSALPAVGEVWRVLEPEGCGPRLDDWCPGGVL